MRHQVLGGGGSNHDDFSLTAKCGGIGTTALVASQGPLPLWGNAIPLRALAPYASPPLTGPYPPPPSEQIHRLNADATQLNALKHQVRALEARQAQQGGPAGGTLAFAYGEDDDGLAGSEGGMSSMIVSPRGLGGHRAGGGDGAASASALMAAMGGGGGSGPAMSTRGDSLSAMRASLEQISRVVNGALIATQAAAAAGRPGAYAGGGGSGGGGFGQALGKPQRGAGGYSSSALLDGFTLPQQRQQGRSMRAVAPALAWGTEYDGGQYNRQYDEVPPPGEDGLSFLGRWKDERDVAQALLQQHSSWLRGFREQIGRARSGGGGGGAAAGPGGMQQQRLSSVVAVGMGGGAKGGGSGVGGGGSGAAGIPMRIPIGNNQEVVVMVQPQH